jgi:hypothetical protein
MYSKRAIHIEDDNSSYRERLFSLRINRSTSTFNKFGSYLESQDEDITTMMLAYDISNKDETGFIRVSNTVYKNNFTELIEAIEG